MAWKADVVDIDLKSAARIIVQFSDGTRKFSEPFDARVPLKPQVLSRVSQLVAQDSNASTVLVGPVDLTPDAPVSQTAKDAYFVLVGRIRSLADSINLGASDDTALLNTLKAQAAVAYKSTYFD